MDFHIRVKRFCDTISKEDGYLFHWLVRLKPFDVLMNPRHLGAEPFRVKIDLIERRPLALVVLNQGDHCIREL